MDFSLARKRATFQALTTTPDGGGGYTEEWAGFTVWAQLMQERALEKIRQGRISDSQAGVVRVRSSTTTRQINDTYRVIVGGVTYNIRGNTNIDQRNDTLEFIVEVDGSVPVGT